MQAFNNSAAQAIRGIPVVDIEQLGRSQTLRALDHACREWGFLQVVGHGISGDLIARVMREAAAFFAHPRATKRQLERTETNPWGYFDRELTKNRLDWKQVFDFGPSDPRSGIHSQWPAWAPSFRTTMSDYYRANEAVAFRLLSAIEQNLGTTRGTLRRGFTPRHTSFMRLNYYPTCSRAEQDLSAAAPAPAGAETMGVNQHTDAGALTILLQDDQAGLEVFRDGNWHLVEPRRDALVINIGDIVQVWSNDRYHAAVHRVVTNGTNDRLSVPFFLNPSYTTNYAPVATTCDPSHPARYRPINWGEFRQARSAGDYQDLGEETQITHFRR